MLYFHEMLLQYRSSFKDIAAFLFKVDVDEVGVCCTVDILCARVKLWWILVSSSVDIFGLKSLVLK